MALSWWPPPPGTAAQAPDSSPSLDGTGHQTRGHPRPALRALALSPASVPTSLLSCQLLRLVPCTSSAPWSCCVSAHWPDPSGAPLEPEAWQPPLRWSQAWRQIARVHLKSCSYQALSQAVCPAVSGWLAQTAPLLKGQVPEQGTPVNRCTAVSWGLTGHRSFPHTLHHRLATTPGSSLNPRTPLLIPLVRQSQAMAAPESHLNHR